MDEHTTEAADVAGNSATNADTITSGSTNNSTANTSAAASSDTNVDTAAQIAADVLRECRSVLMTKMRFLDVALWHLEEKPADAIATPAPLETDGTTLRYNPLALALRFRGAPNDAVRDYLHVVLHCLFRHPFDEKHENARAWSLACDAAAENLALDLCGERFPTARDASRTQELRRLEKRCGSLAPHKLYQAFASAASPAELEQLSALEALFLRDDHRLWACMQQEDEPEDEQHDRAENPLPAQASSDADDPSDGASNPSTEDDAPNDTSASENTPSEPSPADESAENTPDPYNPQDPRDDAPDEDAENAWKTIAKQVELDLAAHSLTWGEGGGSLIAALAVANRQTCDYADFLRKFSVLTEDTRVNEDEFDYIFYTYGLARYGNMPLVEPLEYQECDRIREFVVAIDTSGSCSGALVRTFISRTFDILKESESFGSQVNVHIVQCDARIQSDEKITSLRELDHYLESFTLRGFGGTDFRPVFDYVDALIEQGEFENLRGLIYFTDGMGVFPTRKPDYDTAFVFVNDEMATPRVPPWAMKAVLDEAGVNEI